MKDTEDLEQRLALARFGLSSTGDARARVRHRLAERGAFSPAPAVATARRGVPRSWSAVLVGAAFAAGYWLRDIQPEPSRVSPSVVAPPLPPASTSAASTAASPAAAPSALVTPEVRAQALDPIESVTAARRKAPPLSSRPRAARSTSATDSARPADVRSSTPTAAGVSGELALLRRAERAIRTGDPALALLLLDELERVYPDSALGEERSVAHILVECARSGALAKPEALRFIEKHPSSVYSDRILRACRLEASRAPDSSTDVSAGEH